MKTILGITAIIIFLVSMGALAVFLRTISKMADEPQKLASV